MIPEMNMRTFSCGYKNKVFQALKKELRTKLHAKLMKCKNHFSKVSLFSRWNSRLYRINTWLLNSIFASIRHTCFLINSYLKRNNARILRLLRRHTMSRYRYLNDIISRCLRTCISSSYVAL
jgi:hypothetical protein